MCQVDVGFMSLLLLWEPANCSGAQQIGIVELSNLSPTLD